MINRGGVPKDVLGFENVLEDTFLSLDLVLEGQVLSLGLEDQVLGFGLGLEASSPQKLPCPRLEDSTIFCTVEILLENARNLAENLPRPFLFSTIGDRLKNFVIINVRRCNRICYCWVKSTHTLRRPDSGPLQL